jgi:hypothetical protein
LVKGKGLGREFMSEGTVIILYYNVVLLEVAFFVVTSKNSRSEHIQDTDSTVLVVYERKVLLYLVRVPVTP